MDLTILSSRIFTGDPSTPWAEAICIQGNRIAAVGTNEEIKQVSGKNAEVIELPGRLITPGFADSHTHFITFGMTLRWVDLNHLTSLAACRERIQQAIATRQPGEWIIGRGWNHHLWEEGREPTRADLDDLAPEHPVMMIRTCGHSIWVNSLALARAGITRDTPQPDGGKIDKDPATGEPTGILREARHLIEAHIPPTTLEERKQVALEAQREMFRLGLTAIRSMEGIEQWEALDALDQEGLLKLRIYHLVQGAQVEEAAARGLTPGSGSDRLWFGHAKLFTDGSLGADTALLHEPYEHQPENSGIACLTPEELRKSVETAYQHGYDVAIHAIGDKAVTNALNAIAEARTNFPGPWRDSIEHVQLIRPQDLALFKELGVISSMQPSFITTDWQVAEEKWGKERCKSAYALKLFLDQGIPLQFSTDVPVESCAPIPGLYVAVTRQTPDGEPAGGWYPEHCLTLEEAITAYTRQYANTTHRDELLGSLSVGKWADLTIFEQDLFALSPKEWLSTDVEMTIVDGEIVYHKGVTP